MASAHIGWNERLASARSASDGYPGAGLARPGHRDWRLEYLSLTLKSIVPVACGNGMLLDPGWLHRDGPHSTASWPDHGVMAATTIVPVYVMWQAAAHCSPRRRRGDGRTAALKFRL